MRSKQLRKFITGIKEQVKLSAYYRHYVEAVARVQIISLEYVEKQLKLGNEFDKIEWLPQPEEHRNLPDLHQRSVKKKKKQNTRSAITDATPG